MSMPLYSLLMLRYCSIFWIRTSLEGGLAQMQNVMSDVLIAKIDP
jgi:hypothetical protein